MAEGRALDQVRRHLQPQLRKGRVFDRRKRVEGPIRFHGLGHRQLICRLPPRSSEPGSRTAEHPRRHPDGHVLERLGAFRPGRLEAEPEADVLCRAFATKWSASSSTTTTSTRTSFERWRSSPGPQRADRRLPAARGAAARTHAGRGRIRRRPRTDPDRPQQPEPAGRVRAATRREQQDGIARWLRDVPSDGSGAGRAGHHVPQSVPLHHHESPADASARILDGNGERVTGLREPGHPARSRAAGHLSVQPDARTRAARESWRARQLHRLDDEEAARPSRLQHGPGERGAA